jgi:hypothetical protein
LIAIYSFSIRAEELNLNCEGDREITSIPNPIPKTSDPEKIRKSTEAAFITIDRDTNSFKLSGSFLAATILDQGFKDFIFMTNETDFKFAKRYKTSEIDAVSTLTINRYTGQMEIYNAIFQRSGMVTDTSKMFCKTVTAKKF